jgi:hypothetical protein
LDAVFAAGALDAVEVASLLLVALGAAAAGAEGADVAGAFDALPPLHSATPPCPLQAPFLVALVVYDPSLHFPVAPAGGVAGLASAVADVAFFSVFDELSLVLVASHSATPPCPLQAPRFEALSV